jgi:ribonuclease HI
VKKIIIYTDGAARGNPGPAGMGIYICDEKGSVVKEIARYIGETTNNQAEYLALIEGLKAVSEIGADLVEIFADSELMVSQVKGLYKVKNEGLKPLFEEVKSLLQNFSRYNIKHVPRERNREADRLANKAIDEHFDL